MRPLILGLMLIILSHYTWADSSSFDGIFQVKNSLPEVKLSLYEDESFTDIRDSFSLGENAYLRIEIRDENGYEDINDVGVRLAGIDGNDEFAIAGFEDYRNAYFVNGKGVHSVYDYMFNASDDFNRYRLYVRVRDSKEVVVSSLYFDLASKDKLTGQVILEKRRVDVIGFLRLIVRKILGLF